MCPNCNANMQALNRSGVEFDMCPTCRGVWLDRGELEKIIESTRGELAAPAPAANPHPQRSYGERGEFGERGEYGYGRRRRGSLFDLFD
ncbi:MAG: zf-TFIIB domain-containing protein [Hyphomonadaceae bacterium]|nr:zf-TFIIB domain-containing protein [Hyphomonadaceae bacterium]